MCGGREAFVRRCRGTPSASCRVRGQMQILIKRGSLRGRGFVILNGVKRTDFALLSRVCAYLAITLGVGCLFTGIVTVSPWQQESFNRACLTFLMETLTVATLAAVFRGVARARGQSQKSVGWRRVVGRVVFWLLIPLGAFAFAEGHACHVRAKSLEAQMTEIVARTGIYHNPYWERQWLCDLLGGALVGGFALWTWLALVAQAAEAKARARRGVERLKVKRLKG